MGEKRNWTKGKSRGNSLQTEEMACRILATLFVRANIWNLSKCPSIRDLFTKKTPWNN